MGSATSRSAAAGVEPNPAARAARGPAGGLIPSPASTRWWLPKLNRTTDLSWEGAGAVWGRSSHRPGTGACSGAVQPGCPQPGQPKGRKLVPAAHSLHMAAAGRTRHVCDGGLRADGPELGSETEPAELRAAGGLPASRNAARAPAGWLCSHPLPPGVPARGPVLPRHGDTAQAGREPQLCGERHGAGQRSRPGRW